ncbi:hypothetical protein E2C01_036856 [Portunus trituberculatus]|uniref:Uncharacterized protein n=1 Tax=Portunus trituberculatus TaxID=210409 RepID=A0A5B7FD38_PORTR|nr:hypothetical protein [Portunus trituberculatus]
MVLRHIGAGDGSPVDQGGAGRRDSARRERRGRWGEKTAGWKNEEISDEGTRSDVRPRLPIQVSLMEGRCQHLVIPQRPDSQNSSERSHRPHRLAPSAASEGKLF